jgi:hypothetical protein
MSRVDSGPGKLTVGEYNTLNAVMDEARLMAQDHAYKRPKMTTLTEEFAEAVLASRGKHDDPLRLELMQIMTVCANLVWQIDLYGEDEVSNLRTRLPIRGNQEPVNK